MTTISDRLFDGAKGGVGERVQFIATSTRASTGSVGIVGPAPVDVTVTPGTGAFTTPDLEPGPYQVRILWQKSKAPEYHDIIIPTTGTGIRLFPLITSYVAIPPETPTQRITGAVAQYLTDNPPAGGGGLTEQQIANAAVTPGAPIQTALAQTYAPLWQASTAYTAGKAVLLPNGKTGTRTTTGTSRASFDATEAAAWTVAAGSSFSPTAQTVVVAGDSIAAQCESEAISLTNGIYSQYSWTNWANVYLGHRLNVVANAGIGGNRTDQLLTRLDADVLSVASDWVFLSIGVNNIFDGTGVTVAQTKADYTAIFEKIAAAGRMCALLVPSPSGFGTATTLANLAQIQSWLRAYARSNRGLVLVESAVYATDPVDGWPISGYARPGDSTASNNQRGVHPGYLWAAKIGKAVCEALEPYFLRAGYGEVATNSDATNALSNGRLVGNASGLPTGYSLTKAADGTAATGTAKKVARTDGVPGEYVEVYIPPATHATESPRLFVQDLTPGGRWNIGDVVYAHVEFETDTDTAGSYIGGLTMTFWNGLGTTQGVTFATNDRNATPAPPAGVDVLPRRGAWRTPAKAIPTGTGRLQLAIPLPYGTTRILSVRITKVV